MRIIAGTARSLPLKTIEGLETRPTTDKIKETLFNMLQNDVPGCYFLDLFAGSGQIGLEAISRGALYAVFIENNRNRGVEPRRRARVVRRAEQSCSRLYPAEFKIYEAGTAGSAPAHGSACSSAVASGTGAF